MIDDKAPPDDFADATKINDRMSRYPSDMIFHRLRWYDKTKVKASWLLIYLDFRLLNPHA